MKNIENIVFNQISISTYQFLDKLNHIRQTNLSFTLQLQCKSLIFLLDYFYTILLIT